MKFEHETEQSFAARILRARKYDIEKALAMLHASSQWRREKRPREIAARPMEEILGCPEYELRHFYPNRYLDQFDVEWRPVYFEQTGKVRLGPSSTEFVVGAAVPGRYSISWHALSIIFIGICVLCSPFAFADRYSRCSVLDNPGCARGRPSGNRRRHECPKVRPCIAILRWVKIDSILRLQHHREWKGNRWVAGWPRQRDSGTMGTSRRARSTCWTWRVSRLGCFQV